jgi:hypothetical protein
MVPQASNTTPSGADARHNDMLWSGVSCDHAHDGATSHRQSRGTARETPPKGQARVPLQGHPGLTGVTKVATQTALTATGSTASTGGSVFVVTRRRYQWAESFQTRSRVS